MDAKMSKYFTYFFYMSFFIGFMILLFGNAGNPAVLWIYIGFAAAMILYHKTYSKRPGKGQNFLWVFLISALYIQYFDNTRFIGFYVWILIFYAILFYKVSLISPFVIVSFLSHITLLAVYFYKTPASGFLSDFSAVIIPRLIMLLMVIVMRNAIVVSNENRKLSDSLRENAAKLEGALSQLSVYTAELEKTADLRARDKLMHELHDKLGHSLSTASIGAQAATILSDTNPAAAKERMEMVSGQIRASMMYLRHVISGEHYEQNETDSGLVFSLKKLIEETERETGVPIKNNLSGLPDAEFETLPKSKRTFIYNALMEGLTNGIRHADPTQFCFSLNMQDSQVEFTLWNDDLNDGISSCNLSYGYGLSKMTSEAVNFGGMVDTSNQDGFLLKITLPVDTETEAHRNGQN